MAEVLTTGSNGVSYGYTHKVTAQDAADGELIIDFQTSLDLVASVQVYTDAGVVVDTSDMVVSYPAVGQVKIESGAETFSITENYRIDVIAQMARGDV